MKNAIAFILIIASIGLFYVYIDPTIGEIKTLRAQKAEYDEALNNSQKIQGLRDELLNKYNSFAPNDLKRLDKLLPSYVDNIRFIIEMDSIASRHNMILKNVKVSVPEQSAASIPSDTSNAALPASVSLYGTAEVSFDVSGSYTAYRGFLKDIEQNLRIIDITGISLEAGSDNKSEDKKSSEPVYTFKTSVQTYWLKS